MSRLLKRFLPFSLIFSSVFMVWQTLRVIADSSSPLVVVTSESMEPAFSRGDILFVWNRIEKIEVGNIAVCWLEGRSLPMVHRVIKTVSSITDRAAPSINERPVYQFLTKGDNNDNNDTVLYPSGRPFLHRRDIIGIVKGCLPYLGWVTILFTENAWIKEAILAGVVFITLLQEAVKDKHRPDRQSVRPVA